MFRCMQPCWWGMSFAFPGLLVCDAVSWKEVDKHDRLTPVGLAARAIELLLTPPFTFDRLEARGL
jgi:hypothetical protein